MNMQEIMASVLLIGVIVILSLPALKAFVRWHFWGGKLLERRLPKNYANQVTQMDWKRRNFG